VRVYLGVDVGSVSTKLAVLNEAEELTSHVYLPTQGNPIEAVQEGLRRIKDALSSDIRIGGVSVTGSARYLIGVVTGADLVKNEITCHAVSALKYLPDVQTVFEIGGQDSKLIIIRDGVVTNFAMNTVCAAGTGSFLDHQAQRLNMTIEELSERALDGKNPVRIAGRCTVFAESDMVHKQQMGYRTEDIVYGLCQALVRNYLNNLRTGKEIKPPIVFQGGVSRNKGIVKAFEEELKTEITIPLYPEVMGAIGAALLVKEANYPKSHFKGLKVTEEAFRTSSFECQNCPNHCEIAEISQNGLVLARWGGRCNRWEVVPEGEKVA